MDLFHAAEERAGPAMGEPPQATGELSLPSPTPGFCRREWALPDVGIVEWV